MKTKTVFLKLCILIGVLILTSCLKKNHPPTIDDQTFSIDENSPVGTLVGKVLAFDDEDHSLSYSILGGNTNDAFTVSETDGKISVNRKEALDFETSPSFTLNIEVKDSKNKSAVADIIINLNNKEVAIVDQSFNVDENSEAGSLVGQIAPGLSLSYSIVSGNTSTAFELSATDGNIKVHNPDALDYETTPSFTLVVNVTDENNEKANVNITINLNNLDIPTSGLMLYMPFDGNVNDSSPNNNNGLDQTSHNYVAGKKSQGLDFNGTSDYVQLTYSINAQNGLSFSFWINSRGVNGVQNNGILLSKYSKNNNTRSFMVYTFGASTLRSDNRLSAAFYSDGSTSTFYHDMTKSFLEPGELTVYPNPLLWTITNPTRLILGEWIHCVVNVTPTSIETWINGKFCTKKQREYTSYFNSYTEPVLIGNCYDSGDGSNNHFNGILDELRIYNRGLSTSEIRTLFKE